MEWVLLVVLVATFVQSVSGFGMALIAMPLLVSLIGIEQAAPLVALIGITTQGVLSLKYRAALQWRAIRELAIGSVLGIPLGVLILRTVNESIVVFGLGVGVIAYALYAWFAPRLPSLSDTRWGYGFGFVGGLITGAYSAGGPPLVIYGHCQRWEPRAFKGNMQILLVIHSITVIIAHAISQNYTSNVISYFLWSIPALMVGTLLGFGLDPYINDRMFYRLILILLMGVGLRLLYMVM